MYLHGRSVDNKHFSFADDSRQWKITTLNNQPSLCKVATCRSHKLGYKLVGDNIDITVNARYLRADNHRDQSLHFFHSYAVLDKINMGTLPIDLPASCNPSPLNMAQSLLPSQEHDASLLNNLAILISRVLATHMPFFQFAFSDVVTWHIHHRFYKEMSSKSNVVSSHSIHQLCG